MNEDRIELAKARIESGFYDDEFTLGAILDHCMEDILADMRRTPSKPEGQKEEAEES
jgi:hypothetical protein